MPPAAIALPPVDNGATFGDLGQPDETPAKTRRKKVKKSGTLWIGAVVAVAVLGLAVVIVGFSWSKLTKLQPSPSTVAVNTDKAASDKDLILVKDGVKDGSPAADGKPDPHKDKSHKDKLTDPQKEKPSDPNKDKVSTPTKDKDKVVNPNKDKPDPNKDKPVNPNKDKPDPNKDKVVNPPDVKLAFPRRALVISLHNYLYADTVGAGQPLDGARNVMALKNRLSAGMRFPLTQIGFLSDVAPKGQAHTPTKTVIQETLVNFLQTSRPQDRVMVFFIGHAVEIGDEAYLVPIEGELENADGLIPLKWVYKQLDECKARQKVLVLDVGRSNPSRGAERPGTGPMGPKLDAALKDPPAGVQVWSACSGEQFSYETDSDPEGVFLDKLEVALEKGLTGKIQRPDESLLLELFNDHIKDLMKSDLAPFKLTQTPRITGKEKEDGTPFNKDEPAPPPPQIAAAPNTAGNAKIIQGVLDEISVPPMKPAFGATSEVALKMEMLPPFDAKTMENYPNGESKLQEPIQAVRVALWAYSTFPEPPSLSNAVKEQRAAFKNASLGILKDTYRVPGNENEFKKQIGNEEREVGKILSNLKRVHDDFAKGDAADLRKAETNKRWQCNYDFVLAHLEAEIAFLYEYQSMLGGMTKELPPKEPGTSGWRMSSTATPTGDSDGKKMAKASGKLYDAITAENPNTPWFVLAKRERMIGLGLEWKPTK